MRAAEGGADEVLAWRRPTEAPLGRTRCVTCIGTMRARLSCRSDGDGAHRCRLEPDAAAAARFARRSLRAAVSLSRKALRFCPRLGRRFGRLYAPGGSASPFMTVVLVTCGVSLCRRR